MTNDVEYDSEYCTEANVILEPLLMEQLEKTIDGIERLKYPLVHNPIRIFKELGEPLPIDFGCFNEPHLEGRGVLP